MIPNHEGMGVYYFEPGEPGRPKRKDRNPNTYMETPPSIVNGVVRGTQSVSPPYSGWFEAGTGTGTGTGTGSTCLRSPLNRQQTLYVPPVRPKLYVGAGPAQPPLPPPQRPLSPHGRGDSAQWPPWAADRPAYTPHTTVASPGQTAGLAATATSTTTIPITTIPTIIVPSALGMHTPGINGSRSSRSGDGDAGVYTSLLTSRGNRASGSSSISELGAVLDCLRRRVEQPVESAGGAVGGSVGGTATSGVLVDPNGSNLPQEHVQPTSASARLATNKDDGHHRLRSQVVPDDQRRLDPSANYPAPSAHTHHPLTNVAAETENTMVLQLREILAMKDKVIEHLRGKLVAAMTTPVATPLPSPTEVDCNLSAETFAHSKTKVGLRDALQQLTAVTAQLAAETQKRVQERERYQQTLASINERADDQVRKYALLGERSKELEMEVAQADLHCKEHEDEIATLHTSIKELKAAHRRERQDWNLQLQQQRFYANAL
jgi:hypothetical protein